MRRRSLEGYLKHIQNTRWKHPLFYLLLVFSVFYLLGNYFHRALYRFRILSYVRADAYTVSIGNITWGGGGKTSFIELLGNALPTLAIVCKNMSGASGVVEVDERLPAEAVGDEALLHAKNVKHADVFACKNKWEGALKAGKKEKLVLVDDGMQHYKLWRDLNVVCLNGDAPFGNGFPIPAGSMRELPQELTRADYVVINNAKKNEPHPLSGRLASPVIEVAYVPMVSLPARAVAFCGLGAPESFFRMLKEYGVNLVHTETLADHQAIDKGTLETLQKIGEEQGCEAILCTEKDFIKIEEFVSSPLPIKPVLCELEIRRGKEAFDTLVRVLRFHAEQESDTL